MRKVLFLYNPVSGSRHEARVDKVTAAAEVFRRAGVETTLEAMTGPGSATQQAKAAAESGYDTVIACGGDGSIHEALQGIVNRTIALGTLPLGTANALAYDLGLGRDPVRVAQRLLESTPRPIRLARIDFANPVGKVTDHSRYFFLGAGIGADARLTYKLAAKLKSRWGMNAYYAEAWRQWLTYPYPLFEVEFREGDRLRREQVSEVLAIRIEKLSGLLRRLAPGASLYRDDLRLLLVKSRRRWSYVRYVAGIQFNRAWTGNDIELCYATELTCRPLDESRIYAQADGDLLATLPVSIKMADATVNLLVPRKTRSSQEKGPAA